MTRTTLIHTYPEQSLYRIAYLAEEFTLDPHDDQEAPQEYWWEEVDRVYPLVYEGMSQGDSQVPESEPTLEAERLERFGTTHVDQESTNDRADTSEQEADQLGSPTQGDGTEGRKKRRRSLSQRNLKKQRGNAASYSSTEDKNPNKGRKPTKDKTVNKDGGLSERDLRQKQREQRVTEGGSKRSRVNKKKQEQDLRKQISRSYREARSPTPASSPRNTTNAMPSRPATPARNQVPMPGRSPYTSQSPNNPLLRPPSFSPVPTPPLFNQRPHGQPGEHAAQEPETGFAPGASDDQDITPEGLAREAHRRMLEENNPVPELANKKKAKIKVPDDFTFEITYPDMTPIYDDFMIAADMLGDAKEKADKAKNEGKSRRDPKIKLKIDSRKLKCGDWIVMAEDDYTKQWLADYLSTEEFTAKFRATLVSERGDDYKYTLRIQPPASKIPNEEILEHLFEDFEEVGYVRIINDTRFYKDKDNSGSTNKAYHKILEKGD